MATFPTSAVLRYLPGDADEWPDMQCQHVFVLPGVPQYFENNIKRLAAHLPTAPSAPARREHGRAGPPPRAGRPALPAPRGDTHRLVLSLEEDAIVAALNASMAAHPHVSFGSYPIVEDSRHKTIVTLEGRRYNGGYAGGTLARGVV
jgi:molybdopterin-biosynthesis enzyme MoeA-like protein